MASFYTTATTESSNRLTMDIEENTFGFTLQTSPLRMFPEDDADPAVQPTSAANIDFTVSKEIFPCEECGTDRFTKCWHQMSYEEWLEDVRRQETLRRDAAAPAPAQRPPPPGTVEVFLCPRNQRRHQRRWPRPTSQSLIKKPLHVQMLKVHHRQKMLPMLLEMAPQQQMAWSDDEDDVNVIF